MPLGTNRTIWAKGGFNWFSVCSVVAGAPGSAIASRMDSGREKIGVRFIAREGGVVDLKLREYGLMRVRDGPERVRKFGEVGVVAGL